MLFLLIGLGVLAASAASWALLLADAAFSDAILQDGILTFWWNSLSLLLSEPAWLVSTPSIAVPLLAATVGPFVGLPVAGVGVVALWRRPKEIEVQGRAARPAPVFRPAESRPSARPAPASMRRPIEEREEDAVPFPRMSPVDAGEERKEEDVSSARSRPSKGPGIGAKVGGLAAGIGTALSGLSGLLAGMRAKSAAASERRAARKAAAAERRQVAAEAPARPEAQTAALSEMDDLQPLPDRIMAWYAAWVTVRAGQRPPRMLEDARRLSGELTAETRAAMTSYGMRGATALSMLESAAAAGMARGMEEEDVAPPLRHEGRSASEPAMPADADEFMREVDAPEAYGRDEEMPIRSSQTAEVPSEGPVVIEDDIAAPVPIASRIEPAGRGEEVGPVVIEDDIGMPRTDRSESSREEALAARRVMGRQGREEVATGIEESEFLPAPGTLEPLASGSGIATTATTGWDEVEVREAPLAAASSGESVGTGDVDLNGFLAEAEAARPVGPVSDVVATVVSDGPAPAPQDAVVAAEEEAQEGWKPFGDAAPETSADAGGQEPVAAGQDGWPADGAEEVAQTPVADLPVDTDGAAAEGWPGAYLPSPVAEVTPDATPEMTEAPAAGAAHAQTRIEEGWPADVPPVATETAPVEDASGMVADLPTEPVAKTVEEGPSVPSPEPAGKVVETEHGTSDAAEPAEAFPSGIEAEAQEAVIGPLLADPLRRATILGEREGSPAWTLRRLELHGLLGLSDRTNPAVVRMWEALDRLVAHQARIFAWESLKETPPAAFATPEQRAAHVVDLAREVVSERGRVGPSLLEEIRRLKAGTEHVAWMDDRVDSLLAAMTSAKVMAQLGEFLPKPEEGKAEAGGRLLKVMTGRKEPEAAALVETAYEDLLAASHDIHQRYKEICKGMMIPIYRSLSVKVKEEDGRPAYAQVELVMGDVAATKPRNAAPEGAIGIVFAKVPAGQWRIAEANGRATQDRLVLEGVGENAGRLVRLRDRSLDIFRRWVEGRNMRAFGVIHLLCEEGAVVDGIDRRWDGVEFVRNPWGQKDLEAFQKNRLRPKVG